MTPNHAIKNSEAINEKIQSTLNSIRGKEIPEAVLGKIESSITKQAI